MKRKPLRKNRGVAIVAGAMLLLSGLVALPAQAAPSQEDIDRIIAEADSTAQAIANLEVLLAANNAAAEEAAIAASIATEAYLVANEELIEAQEAEAAALAEQTKADDALTAAATELAAIAVTSYRNGGDLNELEVFLTAGGVENALSAKSYLQRRGQQTDGLLQRYEAAELVAGIAHKTAAEATATRESANATLQTRASQAQERSDEALAAVADTQARHQELLIRLADLRDTTVEMEAQRQADLERQRIERENTVARNQVTDRVPVVDADDDAAAPTAGGSTGEQANATPADGGQATTEAAAQPTTQAPATTAPTTTAPTTSAPQPTTAAPTTPAPRPTTAPAPTTPAPRPTTAPAPTTPAPRPTTAAPRPTTTAPTTAAPTTAQPTTPAPTTAAPKPQPAPTKPAVPADPPSSGAGLKALEWARTQLGKPYVYGAAGPNSYDCSGLTMRAFESAGVKLPRNSKAQYNVGTKVSVNNMKPGDIFFYSSNGSASGIYHVAIYAGNGMRLHAPSPGKSVELVPMWWSNVLPLAVRL